MFDVRTCCLVLNVCLKGTQCAVARYWSIRSLRALLKVHLVRTSPWYFSQALDTEKAHTLPVGAKSVEWSLLPFDGTTMSIKWQSLKQEASWPCEYGGVCFWGRYFYFKLFKSWCKVENVRSFFKFALGMCILLPPSVNSEHFSRSLWHIQSFALSEYSECTLGSGQGGGAAMPSNVYTTSQMGAI